MHDFTRHHRPADLEPTVETGKVPVEGWSNQDAAVKLGV